MYWDRYIFNKKNLHVAYHFQYIKLKMTVNGKIHVIKYFKLTFTSHIDIDRKLFHFFL